MEAQFISALPQLGVAGVAIWVMYLMYKLSDIRFREKDETLMVQVAKHEDTLRKHHEYMKEVQQNLATQIVNSNRIMENNVKAYERVISHLDNHN